MNCHECKFVQNIVGDEHKSCGVFDSFEDSEFAKLFFSTGEFSMIYKDEHGNEKPMIDIDPHGRANGWATWPVNFDPVWINSCILFTKNK